MANGARFREVCLDCGWVHAERGQRHRCRACNGIMEAQYDLAQVRIYDDEARAVLRYRDLLPIRDPSLLVTLGAGNTPTIHAKALGRLFGLEHLYLKDETKNPTGTTKDRPAEVVLSACLERGVTHLCSAATGNSSTAFAVASIATPPFEHTCFIGSRWKKRLSFPAHPRIHVHILEDGTVADTTAVKRTWEKANGVPPEGGFFNVARREGLKLAFLEAVDQTGVTFDWYVQGVSTGMGVYGVYRGAQQYVGLGRLRHAPRLCCVQESVCDPHVRAFRDGSKAMKPEHTIANPEPGVADALQKGDAGDNYPYLRNIVIESGGTYVSVDSGAITSARRALLEYEGVEACGAGATPVAAVAELARRGVIDPKAHVLLNISGRERDPSLACPEHTTWRKDAAGTWVQV